MIWLIITFYYLSKIILLIYVKIKGLLGRKKEELAKYKKVANKIWYTIFGIAFLFLFIGIISDIINFIKGNIATIKYAVSYFFVAFCYSIFSFFDKLLCEPFFFLILYVPQNIIRIPEDNHNNNDDNNVNQDDNDNNNNNNNKSDLKGDFNVFIQNNNNDDNIGDKDNNIINEKAKIE